MVLTRSSTSFFIQRNGWPLVPVSVTAASTVIEAFEALLASLRRCSVPLLSLTRIVSPTESGANGFGPHLALDDRRRAPGRPDVPRAVHPLLALDPAVLRTALLREVRAGQQLDARHDGLVGPLRDDVHVVQHPVDPQPHQGEAALGLEVDVGGALLEGVGQDVVEGLDHGSGRGVEVGVGPREVLLVAEVERGDPALGELLLRVLEAGLEVVEARVDLLDVGAGRDHQVDVEVLGALDLVDPGPGRERVVHGDRDALGLLVDGDRHDAVAAGERARDRLRDDVEVEVERVDLDVGQPGVRGERLSRSARRSRRRAAAPPARRRGRSPSGRGGPCPPPPRSGRSARQHGEELRPLGSRHGSRPSSSLESPSSLRGLSEPSGGVKSTRARVGER